MFLLGYIIGRSTRSREDTSVEPEPWDRMTLGMWRVCLGLAALCAVGTVAFFVAAWVDAHGIGESLVTVLWFVLGIPAAMWILHLLGR